MNFPDKGYVGFTSDLKDWTEARNKGSKQSTTPFRPWKLVFYSAFNSKEKAIESSRYLKTGSEKAFAGKRLY